MVSPFQLTVNAKDQTDGNLGQGESSLRNTSPKAWKLELLPSTLPFFSINHLFFGP